MKKWLNRSYNNKTNYKWTKMKRFPQFLQKFDRIYPLIPPQTFPTSDPGAICSILSKTESTMIIDSSGNKENQKWFKSYIPYRM